MDRTKFLVILLAISLCGNVFFLLSGGSDPYREDIRRALLYAYHQAFPPPGNGTPAWEDEGGMLDGNATAPFPDASQNESTSGTRPSETEREWEFTADEIARFPNEGGGPNETLQMGLLPDDLGEVPHGEEAEETGGDEISAPLEPEGAGWKTYENAKWRFSLQYPPNWTLKEGASPASVTVITAPVETSCSPQTLQCYEYTAMVTVSIDTNVGTGGLEEYFTKKIAALQQQLGITATSKSAQTILSGERAYWIEYYTRDSRGNPSKRFMQYYALLDRKVYIITYSGPYSTNENVYSRNKADAQKIIESFSVKREYIVV